MLDPTDDLHAGPPNADRGHPWLRATLRWSLAIAVTVGLTYLLVTQLLEALGGMVS